MTGGGLTSCVDSGKCARQSKLKLLRVCKQNPIFACLPIHDMSLIFTAAALLSASGASSASNIILLWTQLNFFFKISPDHLNIDMSWHVRMIETIKQPLETLLMTPWKWPIWVILHCKNCTSENFRTEGGHHFFFTFFGFPSLILTIRSYPENFIASRKCKVTPSINTVAAWV